MSLDDDLQKQLLNLCCRDGTPEQARHAISTMAALLQHDAMTQEQTDAFSPLLKSLTSASKLNRNNKSLVSVLVALAELADNAPKVLASSKGEKAIKFALEMILLGRAHSSTGEDSDEDNNSDNEGIKEDPNDDLETPARSRRKSAKRQSQDRKHTSPGSANGSLLEDESLSVSCRVLCAAVEFLVSYIRSSILFSQSMLSRASKENNSSQFTQDAASLKPPKELVENVFGILSQILRDEGLPPSTQDRRDCRMRQDRAALRQCAAIHLLRLCDTRLYLDQTHLTAARWHTLSTAFLDDERVVRDNVMEELGYMLTGNGKYGKCHGWSRPSMAPRLRFLAMIVLCTDGDHGADHSVANGNAANVGKRSTTTKTNATQCITVLRKMYDVSAEEARAMGHDAERRFETQMKVTLMPEYIVPYAFHLLSFRRETPSAGGSTFSKSTGLTQTSQDDENYEVDGGQQRVLRKRLKWLFDPLVQSLGDSADNISFLLRMTEVMGKFFRPTGIPEKRYAPSSFASASSDSDSENMLIGGQQRGDDTELESAKLKIVCAAAREALLSYVKKDVNLDTYPGTIQLPGNLFKRRASMKNHRKISQEVPSRQVSISQSRSKNKRSARRGSDNMSSTSVVARLDKNDDVESPIINPDSSQESILAPSFSQASKEPSLPSVEDSMSQTLDGSIASRTRRSQRSPSRGLSPLNQSADSQISGPKRLQNSRQSPLATTKKNSVGDGHVHFSPELTIRSIPRQHEPSDFGGLSPIKTKLSPDEDKSMRALLSSGEKTRGTTPPSIVSKISRFTPTASLALTGATVSESPASNTVSGIHSISGDFRTLEADGIPESQFSEEQETKDAKSLGKKRPSPDKGQVTRKRRKGSVPTLINVVRKPRTDSSPKRSNRTRATRNFSKKRSSADDANLDFDGESESESLKAPKNTVRKGKENRASKQVPRKAPKRGLGARN